MKVTQEREAQNSEYLKQSSNTDKSELLEDYDSEQKYEENISLRSLLLTYLVIFFTLAFILPKIYIANQVYYISKDINKQYHKYAALREENRYLQKKLETLKYKTQVIDDLEIP